MEEKILKLLESNKSYSVKSIMDELGFTDEELVRQTLNNMLNELILHKNNKNKFLLFENCNLIKGNVTISDKGFGFLYSEDGERIFIPAKELKDVIDGDLISIDVVEYTDGKKEGKLVRVAPRKESIYVGEILHKKNKVFVILDNKKLDYTINVDKNTILADGTKVVVSFLEDGSKSYKANIVKVLGHKNDPGVDLQSILIDHNIDTEFPNSVVEQANNIPNHVTDEEIEELLNKGGKDLRNENVFTIDGDDTKDIDDALSLTILPNGFYNLKVHIANVSHYAKPGTPIFNEAVYKRGTSVYLPGSSIPMIPRSLSNGICSLNPEVDRLALTFDMVFDKQGHQVSFEVYESIITSRKQMTYKKVNEILEKDIVPEGYEPFVKDLKQMHKLSKLLRKIKVNNGFIDFEINENKISLDENGHTKSITLYERGEAEKLIEDFMVETGEATSRFLDDNKMLNRHIYRIHGEPREIKIDEFKMFLSVLGYSAPELDNISPKVMQELLDSLKEEKEYLTIAREMLKCMQKARYSIKNIGHFALATDSDCQVTSPIRRSGDLANHVLIKDAIYNKVTSSFSDREMILISQIASNTERNADDCEKEASKVKSAEYMIGHIGEELTGVITGFCEDGMFVELPNLVEGIVTYNSFKDDNYVYQKEKFALIGTTTKNKYRLGDQVDIKVVGASKDQGKVFFVINNEENEKIKKKNIV